MSKDFLASLAILKSQLSGEMPTPVLLAITSARQNDGSALLATMLARTLRNDESRTLVVTLAAEYGQGMADVGSIEPGELRQVIHESTFFGQSRTHDTLSVSAVNENGILCLAAVRSVAKILLETYAYVIVDAPQPMHDSQALTWLNVADRILIAIRRGRSIYEEDRQLRDLLNGTEKTLGVVAMDPAVLATYGSSMTGVSAQKVPTVHGEHTPAQKPFLGQV